MEYNKDKKAHRKRDGVSSMADLLDARSEKEVSREKESSNTELYGHVLLLNSSRRRIFKYSYDEVVNLLQGDRGKEK